MRQKDSIWPSDGNRISIYPYHDGELVLSSGCRKGEPMSVTYEA